MIVHDVSVELAQALVYFLDRALDSFAAICFSTFTPQNVLFVMMLKEKYLQHLHVYGRSFLWFDLFSTIVAGF